MMDLTTFIEDSSNSIFLKSDVPLRTKNEPCSMGIDEAGRGPVLGPMVYGSFYCPLSEEKKLKSMGFADSKTLTEEKREELFEKIAEEVDCLGWMIEIHSPNIISNKMLRRCKYNLNSISQDSAAELIRQTLLAGVNLQEVYVDTVGKPETYEAKLSQAFPTLKITVAKKADSTFPVVSAASICAKVARDRCVKSWKYVEGSDFDGQSYGSGYPADPETKKFLAKNVDPVFGFPQIVRFSWSTTEKLLESKAVPVTWDEEDEPMEKDSTSISLLQFFNKTPQSNASTVPKTHSYFTERCIVQVSTL